MKKLDQKGMIGLVEIGVIVLVALVVGFVGYRIGTARSEVSDITANAQNDAGLDEAAQLALKEQEENKEEVEVPKEEKTEEPVVKEEKPVVEEPIKEEKPVEEVKEKPTYIKFEGVYANQSGDSIAVTARMASAHTGTCYIKFKKDGQEKVLKEKAISSSNNCDTSVAASAFPVAGEWTMYVWFASSDKTVEAYSDTKVVNVVK